MLSYHNDVAIKEKFVLRFAAHRAVAYSAHSAACLTAYLDHYKIERDTLLNVLKNLK